MRIDTHLLKLEDLIEGYSLSQLWMLREDIVLCKIDLEEIKDRALTLFNFENLRKIEEQLFYINRNIWLVEEAMLKKEGQIFEFIGGNDMCLN